MKYPHLYIEGIKDSISDIENYRVIQLHKKYIAEELTLADYALELTKLAASREELVEELKIWEAKQL